MEGCTRDLYKPISGIGAGLASITSGASTDRKMDSVIDAGGKLWATGDPIIVTDNNYKYGVFNGSCGTVHKIHEAEVIVRFDPKADVDERGVSSIKPGIDSDNDLSFSLAQVSKRKYDDDEKTDKELSTSLMDLAYCLSIHKGQGSQWKNTIIWLPPDKDMTRSNHVNRRLLYTAVTRAESMCIIVGNIAGYLHGIKTDIAHIPNNLHKRITHRAR